MSHFFVVVVDLVSSVTMSSWEGIISAYMVVASSFNIHHGSYPSYP